ncbi:hypothetical protein [Rudaeicoccus suwonensis]|uniref:Uncharacterized protein n=1 Tax=Rudaeicoccus suwonensis TaxID=657409 RepID=A0A561E189_9MICO|nr:hypothetical protein [Rudaeicoccus suwonensis]TWE09369.1 hypothetical protein BKA23_3071 [Rudaeicoccus suwonensis]
MTGETLRDSTTGVRPPRPASVVTAVKLMYAGAALSILTVATTAASRHSLRHTIQDANRHRTGSAHLSAAQVTRAADLTYSVFVTLSLIGLVLWLVMALANRAGHGWARILATVLAVMNVLLIIGFLTRGTPVLALVSVPTLIVGVAATVLLWKPSSTAFFDPDKVVQPRR